jgi:hypothetical protein
MYFQFAGSIGDTLSLFAGVQVIAQYIPIKPLAVFGVFKPECPAITALVCNQQRGRNFNVGFGWVNSVIGLAEDAANEAVL